MEIRKRGNDGMEGREERRKMGGADNEQGRGGKVIKGRKVYEGRKGGRGGAIIREKDMRMGERGA